MAAVAASVLIMIMAVVPGLMKIIDNSSKEEIHIFEKTENTIVFDPVSASGSVEDYAELNNETASAFCREWKYVTESGYTVTIKINSDLSVEMCIRNKFGLENWYDGSAKIIDSGVVELTQSDGITDFRAELEMFIKNGTLCINLISGNMPLENIGKFI